MAESGQDNDKARISLSRKDATLLAVVGCAKPANSMAVDVEVTNSADTDLL